MSQELQATERKDLKGSEIRYLRESGMIPAVIYGKRVENTPITIEKAPLLKEIKAVGKNSMLSIDVEGHNHQVILRSYDQDPLTKDILHVDFMAVDQYTKVTTEVRIVLTGEASGVKDGGVLQQVLRDLSITASATDIPETIEIDITDLNVNETLTVGEIRNQYSFDINFDDDETIVTILPPKQEKEISTGEQQEPGIPENLEGREE